MAENKKIWNTQTIVILVLAVLLVITVGYIVYGAYQTNKAQKEQTLFAQGQQNGAQQTLTVLFQQAATCQPLPILLNNQTITLFATECVAAITANCQPVTIPVGNQTVSLIPTSCINRQ